MYVYRTMYKDLIRTTIYYIISSFLIHPSFHFVEEAEKVEV